MAKKNKQIVVEVQQPQQQQPQGPPSGVSQLMAMMQQQQQQQQQQEMMRQAQAAQQEKADQDHIEQVRVMALNFATLALGAYPGSTVGEIPVKKLLRTAEEIEGWMHGEAVGPDTPFDDL